MKLATWNVNGIRSVLNKDAIQRYIQDSQPDILCLQEIKAEKEQVAHDFSQYGYDAYWYSAVKKGYAGTAIFTKIKPLMVHYGINQEEHDQEGRVITLEFADYYVVTVYTPNAKRTLERLPYRQKWEDDFLAYIQRLNDNKPVIFCGDLNVAHKEIDLANPKANRQNAGFTLEERMKFDAVLQAGYVDAFRYLYPEKQGAYTWWSYMAKARERNIGWRIDYFIVSKRLAQQIKEVNIRHDVFGSDHCPVEMIV